MIPLTGPIDLADIYQEWHKEDPIAPVDVCTYAGLFSITGPPWGLNQFRGKRIVSGEWASWQDPNGNTIIDSSSGSRIMQDGITLEKEHYFMLNNGIEGFNEDPSIAVRIRWSPMTLKRFLNDDNLDFGLTLQYTLADPPIWLSIFNHTLTTTEPATKDFLSGVQNIVLGSPTTSSNFKLRATWRIFGPNDPSTSPLNTDLFIDGGFTVEMAVISSNNANPFGVFTIPMIDTSRNQWDFTSLRIRKGAPLLPGITVSTWNASISGGKTWDDPINAVFNPDSSLSFGELASSKPLGIQTDTGANWRLTRSETWISFGPGDSSIEGSGAPPPLFIDVSVNVTDNLTMLPRFGQITITSLDIPAKFAPKNLPVFQEG